MRKIVAVALWAWIPFCWQPLWGQTPSVGVQKSKEPKAHADGKKDTTKKTEHGTAEVPFVVDTQGHKQTPAEAKEAKASGDHAAYIEGRTLLYACIAALATVALVFIGLGGVIAAIWTLRAIENQGKQADRHLVLIERPWLDPHIQLNGPLEIEGDGGIRLPIVIDITNLGKSPATAITISPQIWMKSRHENIIDALKSLCEQTEGHCMRNANFGDVLFPGPASQSRIEYTIGVSGEDIQRYSWNGVYDAFILLCVAYRSTLDDKIVHYTAPTYHLVRVQEPPNIPTVFSVGESVPPNRLRLSRWFVGPRIK